MKIAICSSMVFLEEMGKVKSELENNDHEVFLPHNTEGYLSGEKDPVQEEETVQNKIENDLFKYYYKVIDNSDAILVLNYDKNGIENYIGGNTLIEMSFAHILDKEIYLISSIPDMRYTDEIEAFEPVVLGGDLGKI